ncbi:hypothetical protein BC629DRAFT_15919 [Irpex lacteus]|nr:hypothetical protein BC629DRAFT_15919 [Irpex lacteus]
MIQDALAAPAKENAKSNSASGSGGVKRPSASLEESATKRRQLPSSWSRTPSQSRSTFSSSGATTTQTSSVVVPASSVSTSSTGKVAPIFLSQEQTHILKLVEKGESLFYTGSAGTSFNSFL